MTAFMIEGHHLRLVTCGSCGVSHAIPVLRWDTCHEEGGYWYCPNGHQWGFRNGVEKNRAIERERDRLKQENARLAQAADNAKLQAEKSEKALARHKKRSAGGVCPCCTRTFANMARHMKSQHPDFNVVPLRATP